MLHLTDLRWKRWHRPRGFTMIELIVVMSVIGLLLTLAVPRYMDSLERGKEHVLAHNLSQIRAAIDQHFGDRGAYPDHLEELVERRYLRAVPLNPFTEAADWLTVLPPPGQKGRIFDVAAPAGLRSPVGADADADYRPATSRSAP